jgi:hypothetical protein
LRRGQVPHVLANRPRGLSWARRARSRRSSVSKIGTSPPFQAAAIRSASVSACARVSCSERMNVSAGPSVTSQRRPIPLAQSELALAGRSGSRRGTPAGSRKHEDESSDPRSRLVPAFVYGYGRPRPSGRGAGRSSEARAKPATERAGVPAGKAGASSCFWRISGPRPPARSRSCFLDSAGTCLAPEATSCVAKRTLAPRGHERLRVLAGVHRDS